MHAVSFSCTTQITGKSSFVDETDGTLLVSFEDRRFQPSSLQSVLSSFGDLLSFEAADPQDQVSTSGDQNIAQVTQLPDHRFIT